MKPLDRLIHHPMVQHMVHHAEAIGNLILVSTTGFHEWGNVVGFACIPLLIVLLVNLASTFQEVS